MFTRTSSLLLRRSFPVRGDAPNRADVSLAMSKWWKAFKHQDGLVREGRKEKRGEREWL